MHQMSVKKIDAVFSENRVVEKLSDYCLQIPKMIKTTKKAGGFGSLKL
jgi:hypothetical protein